MWKLLKAQHSYLEGQCWGCKVMDVLRNGQNVLWSVLERRQAIPQGIFAYVIPPETNLSRSSEINIIKDTKPFKRHSGSYLRLGARKYFNQDLPSNIFLAQNL